MLLLLFAVSIGFVLSYKLADNNLFVSYFVNLPNAILTYMISYTRFTKFNALTIPFAGITILIIIAIFTYFHHIMPKSLFKQHKASF